MTPLIIAGGGGGCSYTMNGYDASYNQVSNNNNSEFSNPTVGYGGKYDSVLTSGGGGAGWFSNGEHGYNLDSRRGEGGFNALSYYNSSSIETSRGGYGGFNAFNGSSGGFGGGLGSGSGS
jgi:hypothetical protein